MHVFPNNSSSPCELKKCMSKKNKREVGFEQRGLECVDDAIKACSKTLCVCSESSESR